MLYFGNSADGNFNYIYNEGAATVKCYNIFGRFEGDKPLTPEINARLSPCCSLMIVDNIRECRVRVEKAGIVEEVVVPKTLMVLYNYLKVQLGYSLRCKIQQTVQRDGCTYTVFLLIVSADVDIMGYLKQISQ